MYSYYTDYAATMPAIAISVNSDTILAINLNLLNLSENDEFIFAVKNYDYVDSPYVFLFRASKKDIDENGEVLFKIPSAISKKLKPTAFYCLSVLTNAFNADIETTHKRLSDNGKIYLDYGIQDLEVKTDLDSADYEIVGVRLELVEEGA